MPGSPDLEKGRVACFPGTLQTVFASGHHLLPGLLLPCPTADPPPGSHPAATGAVTGRHLGTSGWPGSFRQARPHPQRSDSAILGGDPGVTLFFKQLR